MRSCRYRTNPTTKNAAQIKDLVRYHKRTKQEARCHYPFTLAESFFVLLYLWTLVSLLVVASTKGSTKDRVIGGGALLFLHLGIIAIGKFRLTYSFHLPCLTCYEFHLPCLTLCNRLASRRSSRWSRYRCPGRVVGAYRWSRGEKVDQAWIDVPVTGPI